MGNEITYCDVCREQIRTSDFDSGRAFRLDSRNFCLKCGPEALRTLPKDRVKDLFRTLSAPPPPAAPGRSSPPASTRKIIVQKASTSSWVLPAVLATAGVAAAIGWALWPIQPEPVPAPVPAAAPLPPRPAPPPPPERKPEPKPAPSPAPPSPAAAGEKDRAALDALQKARSWAAANPSDFDGAVRRFQEASFLATGTSSAAEASRELELYRQKQREFFARELASLEPDVKAAAAEERFMKALDLLRLARDRHASAEWHLLVGKRTREINDVAFKLLDRVKEEALDAKGGGDEEKVKALRARVASWGVPALLKDFTAALDRP